MIPVDCHFNQITVCKKNLAQGDIFALDLPVLAHGDEG